MAGSPGWGKNRQFRPRLGEGWVAKGRQTWSGSEPASLCRGARVKDFDAGSRVESEGVIFKASLIKATGKGVWGE